MTNLELSTALLRAKKKVSSASVNLGQTVDLDQAYLVNHHALRPIQKEISKQLESAHFEAEEIIEAAKERAQVDYEAVLQQAHDQYEAKREEIIEEAHQKGFLVGQQQAYQEAELQLKLAAEILAQAEIIRDQMLSNASEKILDLASAVSQSILQYESQINPNILANLIQQAIKALAPQEAASQYEIILHPQTLEQLSLASNLGQFELHFKPELRCPKDKIFLQSNNLRWDISPKNQIDQMVMAIKHQENLQQFLLEKDKPTSGHTPVIHGKVNQAQAPDNTSTTISQTLNDSQEEIALTDELDSEHTLTE